MSNPKNCTECHGTGRYIVRNAYEPSFEKEVVCEYCHPNTKGTKFEKEPILN